MLKLLLRFLSFTVALAIAGTIVMYPRIIATDMASVPHGWLALLMCGMSACFVYGIGFEPDNKALKIVFSPVFAWPAIAVALCFIL